MVGAATILGYGSYWLIERPARDYLRARLSSDASAREVGARPAALA
jgi:peptidoglycan/LPS O-acetylase OafA/YrhL